MNDVKKMDLTNITETLSLVSYAFQWELNERNITRYNLLAENSWNYGSFDEAGRLASQVTMTPFAVDFFGQEYQMAGIGFVASYPEYRSQGRIDRIMRQIIADCYENKIVLSYLAPFSYPFYRRYGYELVFERATYNVAAAEWPDSPKVSGRVERVPWEIAKPAVAQLYQQQPDNKRGGVIRSDWWLQYRLYLRKKYTYALYYNAAQEVEGYLIYLIQAGQLQIAEWQYLTGAAFHGLNRFVASHNGSVSRIIYDVAYEGEDLQFLTTTPLENFTVRPEMMARIIDVESFLKDYPFTAAEITPFAVQITDDQYAEWNNGFYEFHHSVEDSTKIVVDKVATSSLPCVVMSIQRFTQAVMGYKKIKDLFFYQLISGDPSAAEQLGKILVKEKPLLEDYF